MHDFFVIVLYTGIAKKASRGEEKMKKTFHEPPRELPVIAETEVLVCGAGPAGIGAALQAARNGAKTMLIEYQDHR